MASKRGASEATATEQRQKKQRCFPAGFKKDARSIKPFRPKFDDLKMAPPFKPLDFPEFPGSHKAELRVYMGGLSQYNA